MGRKRIDPEGWLQNTAVCLAPSDIETIGKIAKGWGVSRSEAVRRILKASITQIRIERGEFVEEKVP